VAKEERFYAFIIAHTSHSRARVQRIRIERKVVSISCVVALCVGVGLVYGFYGLTQQAAHLRTTLENQQLRAENDRQRLELAKLNNRVEQVEDTSRKLAEKSGVVEEATVLPGTGGPELPLDEMALATLASKMSRLEEDMRAYEQVLRERGYTPAIWPVDGELEGGFGGRRNPFGGPGWEFHTGQDSEWSRLFCWLAKWLRTVSHHGPWRRAFYSLWSSLAYRCRSRTTAFQRPTAWQGRIDRTFHRSPPALRGSH
jgi:hypothetical protein